MPAKSPKQPVGPSDQELRQSIKALREKYENTLEITKARWDMLQKGDYKDRSDIMSTVDEFLAMDKMIRDLEEKYQPQ